MGKVIAIDHPPIAETNWAEVYDELGLLSDQLAELAKAKKRYDQLRDKVLSKHAADPPDQIITLEGHKYSVEVSACALERSIISMPKLFKRFGSKLFLQVCKVSLAVIDSYIPEAEQAEFLKQARTGNRSLKLIRKFKEAS